MALVNIDNIIVKERLRPLDDQRVQELMESIRETGLIHPITVTDEHVLLAGHHRLEAFRLLSAQDKGFQIIPVHYYSDEDKALLVEIAENLFRHDLSVLEKAEHLVLYLQSATVTLPAENLAQDLDISRKTFFNYKKIATQIALPVRQAIKKLDSDLKNATRQLLALAQVSESEQKQIIAALKKQPQLSVFDLIAGSKPAVKANTKHKASASFQVPATLKQEITGLAKEKGIAPTQLVQELLAFALKHYRGEERLASDNPSEKT